VSFLQLRILLTYPLPQEITASTKLSDYARSSLLTRRLTQSLIGNTGFRLWSERYDQGPIAPGFRNFASTSGRTDPSIDPYGRILFLIDMSTPRKLLHLRGRWL
jgi:hypothetical protein